MMWVWDSAFGLESRIASARLCDRRSSLISALALQSHDSNLKILESCANYPQNHRKILESCVVRVARKLTFSVIASGVSRVAIQK